MLYYIIQTMAFQLMFLLVYDIFLKRETFFNWNRLYLQLTPILSLVIPLIKIDKFSKVVPQEYIINLPEVFIGGTSTSEIPVTNLKSVMIQPLRISFWESGFYVGMCIVALIFMYKVISLYLLIHKNPRFRDNNLVIVQLLKSAAAFSFFNYIFLGEQIQASEKEAILKHEKVHVREKHSFDLLFFEILKIVFWFNPLVYMYQNRIQTLHEFIADAEALKFHDKKQYYQNLLSQVFETKNISFINPFFKKSLIKKRIVMLQKSKSKQIKLLKYALLIPLIFGMLIYTSAEAQEKIVEESQDLSQYSYTLKKGEKLIGEKKKIHDRYEAFLKYSIHHKNEKIPEGYSKSEVSFPDGSSYITYFNWGAPPPKKLSAKEKKKKEKELLKLKQKYKDSIQVPFAIIDQVPVFPSCKDLSSNNERKACMSKGISMFVNKNFNTEIATELKLTGRQRINVIFKIDSEGNVVDVRSRAPHPALEEEAKRVINLLPKMIPGEHDGKVVNVPYSLPIIFQVADKEDVDKQKDKSLDVEGHELVDIPFALVEQVPIFPGCESLIEKKAQKKCTSNKIAEQVNKNFNTKLAKSLGLKGSQRINVIFHIDTNGDIIKLRSRASHPALEKEAKRVIRLLPKMIPGEHKGEKVNVPYSLPIIFQVAD